MSQMHDQRTPTYISPVKRVKTQPSPLTKPSGFGCAFDELKELFQPSLRPALVEALEKARQEEPDIAKRRARVRLFAMNADSAGPWAFPVDDGKSLVSMGSVDDAERRALAHTRGFWLKQLRALKAVWPAKPDSDVGRAAQCALQWGAWLRGSSPSLASHFSAIGHELRARLLE